MTLKLYLIFILFPLFKLSGMLASESPETYHTVIVPAAPMIESGLSQFNDYLGGLKKLDFISMSKSELIDKLKEIEQKCHDAKTEFNSFLDHQTDKLSSQKIDKFKNAFDEIQKAEINKYTMTINFVLSVIERTEKNEPFVNISNQKLHHDKRGKSFNSFCSADERKFHNQDYVKVTDHNDEM